jgi:hypothetical protein
MNIDTPNIIKITTKDNKIDFILNRKSIFSNKIYNDTTQIQAVEYNPEPHELRYYKKNELVNIATNNSDLFFLARALKLNITDITNHNKSQIIYSYKLKLIRYLKRIYRGGIPQNIEHLVLDAPDASALLQYFPFNSNLQNKKIQYLHYLRMKIYYLLYPSPEYQPFIELDDRGYAWVMNCLSQLNIPGLQFAEFEAPNESLMIIIREKWKHLIDETHSKAADFLQQEENAAKAFDDTDALREIQAIKEEMSKVIAAIDLNTYKTPKQLLRFWPDILLPGPSLIYRLS